MGIWIRSQDREDLICAESIFYDVNEEEFEAELWARSGIGGVKIGVYETKERALEVLDEIGRVINYDSDFVYTMPNK